MNKQPDNADRSILALDYGRSRIGLATGSSVSGIATALTTLQARDGEPDWVRLDSIIAEWRPDLLVLGLPSHTDGSDSEMTAEVRIFAAALEGRYKLTAEFVDERYTSTEAEAQLKHERQQGVKKKRLKKEDIDARAAEIIAASWLQKT